MLEEREAPRVSPDIPWNAGTVREILTRQAYVGDVVWNKESSARCMRWLDGKLSTKTALHMSRRTGRVAAYALNDPADHVVLRDQHPAIVSRDLFERAAESCANVHATRSTPSTGRRGSTP